jgi:hypothetical protein
MPLSAYRPDRCALFIPSLLLIMRNNCRMRARDRGTYGETGRRGPGGFALDIADEGLVDVTSAEEAVA